MEDEVDEKYYVSDRALEGMANHARVNAEKGNGFGARVVSPKANTVVQRCYKDGKDNLLAVLKEMSSRVVDVSFNKDGIRPHRGDNKKSGISDIGTIRFASSKGDTLCTNGKQLIFSPEYRIRRLTPTECAFADRAGVVRVDSIRHTDIPDVR